MAKIYKYRVTFPKSKSFLRDYEVQGDTTLFALHNFLLDDLGFAPDQMIAFKGLDKQQKQKSTYGLFDLGSGTLDGVTIQKTLNKGEEILLYMFDIHNNRYLVLTFVEEVENTFRTSYPRLVYEKGRVPGQFSSKYDNIDDTSIIESENNEEDIVAGFDSEEPEDE